MDGGKENGMDIEIRGAIERVIELWSDHDEICDGYSVGDFRAFRIAGDPDLIVVDLLRTHGYYSWDVRVTDTLDAHGRAVGAWFRASNPTFHPVAPQVAN